MNLKQKKTMRIIRKVVSKIFELFLPIIDRVAYINFFNQPFSNLPVSDLKTYEELSKKADENTYSIEDVDLLEKKNNYFVDREWLKVLAYNTQVVVKNSELNYAHGRVLYSVLRKYLSTLKEENKTVNIIETGTARGFSAICMAKALSDSGFEGSICSIDVLPHFKKMYWNCAADLTTGSQSRKSLLSNWSNLVERYIIFIQGFTKNMLPKISFNRINFAFLDGSHTYEDVLFEFNNINKHQREGDMIIFDDYNERDFPGIVKIVKHIEDQMNYQVEIIQNKKTLRDYAVAKKLTK